MSLFVGNLTSIVTEKDLQKIFDKFGECKVVLKNGTYAFVDYKKEEDAKEAYNNCNSKEVVQGVFIEVKWSKRMKRESRYHQNRSRYTRERRSRSRSRSRSKSRKHESHRGNRHHRHHRERHSGNRERNKLRERKNSKGKNSSLKEKEEDKSLQRSQSSSKSDSKKYSS